MTWNLCSACYLGIHPRDGIPRVSGSLEYFSQRVRFVRSKDGSPLGATRWFGSERSATVKTEESAVPRRGIGQQNLIHFLGLVRQFTGVCVCVDTCRFKWSGSGWVIHISLRYFLLNEKQQLVVFVATSWQQERYTLPISCLSECTVIPSLYGKSKCREQLGRLHFQKASKSIKKMLSKFWKNATLIYPHHITSVTIVFRFVETTFPRPARPVFLNYWLGFDLADLA